jgi:hypothetical protein
MQCECEARMAGECMCGAWADDVDVPTVAAVRLLTASLQRAEVERDQASALADVRAREVARLGEEVEQAKVTVEKQARRITILVMDQRRQLPADVLADIADAHTARDHALSEVTRLTELCDVAGRRIEEVERQRAELESRLFGAEYANATVTATLVEHSELNGHVDMVQQCRDYLAGLVDHEGDPSGRLRDFVASLCVVIDQFDRQRRNRNWYESAYTAGKQKLIESALSKQVEAITVWLETVDPSNDSNGWIDAAITDIRAGRYKGAK